MALIFKGFNSADLSLFPTRINNPTFGADHLGAAGTAVICTNNTGNESVEVANQIVTSGTTWSFGCWFNFTTISIDPGIMMEYDFTAVEGTRIKGSGTRGIRAQFQDSAGSLLSQSNDAAYVLGVWNRLVVTLSSTKVKIYINGIDVFAGVGYSIQDNGTGITGFGPTAEKMRLGGGALPGTGTISIDGSANHMYVWDTELTPSEVLADFNSDFSQPPGPTVGKPVFDNAPVAREMPAHDVHEVTMDVGEAFSEPILLAGRNIISIQAPTLAATDLTIQGANFSSASGGLFKDGLLLPADADFKDLYDASDTQIQIIGTTGNKTWAFVEAGFPIWIRLVLSVPQTVTFHVSAGG